MCATGRARAPCGIPRSPLVQTEGQGATGERRIKENHPFVSSMAQVSASILHDFSREDGWPVIAHVFFEVRDLATATTCTTEALGQFRCKAVSDCQSPSLGGKSHEKVLC